jgi:hypothetical protein
VRQILDGVKTIDAPGAPGPLAVFGGAAPLVVGRASQQTVSPVVAAARWGAGRVVAFGHNGYLGEKSLATADTGRLLLNALRWAAGADASVTPRVGVWKKAEVAAFLRGRGWQAELIDGSTLPARLAACQAVCLDVHSLTDDRWRAALTEYIQRGGGLVAGGLGWGWLQLNSGKTLADHPGNRLLAQAGILWLNGVVGRTADAGFATDTPPSLFCQGNRALEAIVGLDRGRVGKDDQAQATWTILHTIPALPPDDKLFRPALERFSREHTLESMPTRQHPLKLADAAGRLAVALRVTQLKTLPPRQVRADLSAAVFPGAVPAGAHRVRRTVSVDTAVPGWHSTGLYAPAGKVITASAPAGTAAKLSLRIGCHTDELWDKDVWNRCPEITLHKPLDGETALANPFGGPIYVEVGKAAGTVGVTIAGGVEAPYFILGQTLPAQWRQSRLAPAPWAELATSKVILSVPAEVVRGLDDPTALMQYWDRVLDCDAALAGISSQRARPERYVPDVQISAGYMHSGYPIMTHLDAAPMMVNVAQLTAGDNAWGLYHEMGHNHQSPDWTFDGTGEVTVNLFTMYVIEQLCHLPPMQGRAAPTNAQQTKARLAYRAEGKNFETWKKKPFLALQMYVELIDAFGWDALKKVLAEYRGLPAGEHPKTDAEKRDQWMVRYGRTVGRNLGPFFDAWGVPVSARAKAQLSSLPPWMPNEMP